MRMSLHIPLRVLIAVLLSASTMVTAQDRSGILGALGAKPAPQSVAKAAGGPTESATQAAFSTADFTDAWWNAAESGWGLSINHQESTMALVFYVYNQQGGATWFLSPASFVSTAAGYQGPLYSSTGPYFGAGVFNPGGVNQSSVGTATFLPTSIYAGTLTYTVNGVSVTKSVTRFGFNPIVYSGNYIAGVAGTLSTGCASSGPFESATFATINQSGSTFQLAFEGTAATCQITGTYQQSGRLAVVASGTFSCTTGQSGTASLDEIDANRSGVSGRYTTQSSGCTETGRFGAVRR